MASKKNPTACDDRAEAKNVTAKNSASASQSQLFIGVDPGVNGAIALLTAQSELVHIWDMPNLGDGPAGRRNVNAPLLAEIVAKSHATQAFVEYVGARP